MSSHFKKTLVVSFFGGPGCGKSIFAANTFSELKWDGYVVDLALEYIKYKFYEGHVGITDNQVYIFGKQHNHIHRLLNKVQVIVTDSPYILGNVYKHNEYLNKFAISEYKSLNTYNIFLDRNIILYETHGRSQTLNQSVELDINIIDMLVDNDIKFEKIKADKCNVPVIIKNIKKKLEEL